MSPAPVLLLHGQPGTGADFAAVVAGLPAGTTALAPDRPGYGGNATPAGGFEANARWALEQLDRAGLERAVLVGHSWGGGVALTAAALAPERVLGLVLVASVGPGCLDVGDRLLAAPGAGELAARVAWQLTPGLARHAVRRREDALGRRLRPQERPYQQTWGAAAGSTWRSFLLEQRELVGAEAALTARLTQVRAPAVVLADPRDRVVPVAAARALHAALPGSQLVLAARGGHHLPRRAAADVVAATTSLADVVAG